MNILNAFNLKREYSLREKIEFGLATFLFLIALIGIISEGRSEYGALFGIDHLYHIIVISFFYVSFLLLNFIVIPKIGNREVLLMNIIIIALIIAISILFSLQLGDNVLLIGLSLYFFFKYSLLFLWRKFRIFREEKGSFSTGILLAVIFYLILMFFLFAGNADRDAISIPGLLIPFSILIFVYSYQNLIPAARLKGNPFWSYLWNIIAILVGTAIPLALIGFLLLQDEETPFVLVVLNTFLQLFITVPVAWVSFKRYMKGKEEVDKLQKELGQSTAKFDFLRSQINPHFLFNALNTLYGTAIQENADRTGEGIQKLGDMMRFMLHENMQEKISLEREIEYLENYISLQRLRTDPSPEVTIQAQIQQQFEYAQISPMLLIPFVENAFKHGISFREASHIKIALEKKENTLYFDVYNSKHPRVENDPEKDKSGIGLTNVKQRLQLLYPKKHELLIRENSKEFFVHLTLQLS